MLRLLTTQGSTRVRVTAFIAVAALVVIAGIRYVPPLLPDKAAPAPVAITATTDTDGDGVPDWQELLLASDPNNPASTPDPSRSLDTVLAERTGAGSTAPYTDLAAEALARYYVSLKAAGTYNSSLAPQIGQSFADSLKLETVYQPYTRSDFTVTNSVTPAAYDRAVKTATAALLEVSEPELSMYMRLVQGDTAARADLEAAIATFESVVAELVATPVPASAVGIHADAVNALGYFTAVLTHMTARASDPMASIVLLQSFTEAEGRMDVSFGALAQYLSTNQAPNS